MENCDWGKETWHHVALKELRVVLLSCCQFFLKTGLDWLTLPDWESPILKWFYVNFFTASGFYLYNITKGKFSLLVF